MADKIQLRRDTQTNWDNEDPILDSGEAGVNLTTGGIRIGNGIDNWSNLEEISAGGGGMEVLKISLFVEEDIDTTNPVYSGLPSGFIIAALSSESEIVFYETNGTTTLDPYTVTTPLATDLFVMIDTWADTLNDALTMNGNGGRTSVLPAGWVPSNGFSGPYNDYPVKSNAQNIEIGKNVSLSNITPGSERPITLSSLLGAINNKFGESGGGGLESLYIVHIVDGDTLPTTDVRWESAPPGWVIAAESANAGTILFYETDGTDTLVTRTITPLSATTLVAINTKAEDADALFSGSTEAGMFTILPSGWDGTASFWGPMSEFPPKINGQQVEIDGPYANIGVGSGVNDLTSIITGIDTKLGEGGGGGGGTQEITLYRCFVECTDPEIPLVDPFWANIPSGSFVFLRGLDPGGVYVSDGVDTITPQATGVLDQGILVQCSYSFNNWEDMSTMANMRVGDTYLLNAGFDFEDPGSFDPHSFILNIGHMMVGSTYANLGITDEFSRFHNVLGTLDERLPSTPPETGTYIWKSVNGVMSWVEEV